MRRITPAVLGVLSTFVPGQTRQFGPDLHRSPALFLPGSFGAIAVGDVDGDGDLDAIVTRSNFWFLNTEVVLFRRQAGSWQQTVLGAVPGSGGLAPRVDIVLADLDGDTDLDAAVAASDELTGADSRLLFFRNGGAGSFLAFAPTLLSGVTGLAIAAADTDGDSDRDVVLSTRDAAGQPQPLALLRHDGAFGFTAVAGAFPATPATAPAFADLDGDGDPDVVAVDAAGGVLAFTNQSGAFSGSSLGAAPATWVVAADFDGDGDGDPVVQRPDGGLVLLRNTPTGFQPLAIAAGGSFAGPHPVLADLDGDLDTDLAVVVDDELHVLRNGGLASFTEEVVAAAGSFAAGDVDADGTCDLVFQVGGSGFAAGLGRPGRMVIDPVLVRRPFVARSSRGYTEDAADFDSDDRVDVLQQDYWQVLVRHNHGNGAWSTIVLPVQFLRPRTRAADVDGDGDQDIVVVNGDAAGGLQVFLNDGAARFTALPPQALPAARIAGEGDFDGDLRGDLLIGVGSGSTLQLLRSGGGGVFAAPVTVYTGTVDWFEPGVWDFDGDLDLDLLMVPAYGSCAALLTNDGNGNFTVADPCAVSAPPTGMNNMKLVDIDGDSDPDVFTWGYGSGRFLINNGGSFATGATLNGVFGSALLMPRFADWDGDGDMDLLQLGGPAQLWLNDGSGALVDATATRIGWAEFSGAGAADLDGDGDLDVLSVFGMSATDRLNHLRSASSLQVPTAGGQMLVRYAHEPGFATGSSLCIPILTLAPRSTPLRVPGIAGTLQIDMTVAALLPFLTLPAPGGTADSSFAIPVLPDLIGFDLHAQGLILSPGAAAFTPAVHERVL